MSCVSFRKQRPPPALGIFGIRDAGAGPTLWCAAIDMVQVKSSYEAILSALEKGDSRASARLLQEHAASFAPTDDGVR